MNRIIRRFLQAAVISVGSIALLCLLLVVYVVQGYWMPGQLYSLAGVSSVETCNRTQPAHVPSIPSRLRIETLRDIAFTAYNIAPEARMWMKNLPISYAEEGFWAGTYDPDSGRISIRIPQANVIVHEYAHANFDRKPLWDKIAFVLEVTGIGLGNESDHRFGKSILHEELATAVYYGKRRVSYNPVLEYYAHLAELSEGDLRVIPDSLQRYFADYLQPGEDRATLRIGRAGR